MTLKPLHWSGLRHIAKSPAHYRYYLDHGVTVTAAMRFGSLVHAMVLGATRAFVVYPEARRGNVWKDFQAAHEGVEIVTAEEWQRASDCAFAVKANPNAAVLLKSLRERKLAWTFAGRECAGTVDLCGDVLSDLKVTDADPARFPWHALRMGWPAQLTWYEQGVIESGGARPSALSLIAVEPKPPHVVQVYDLTERAAELGRRHWRLLFERLRVCEETDTWPGYCEGIMPLDAPEQCELTIDGEEVTL